MFENPLNTSTNSNESIQTPPENLYLYSCRDQLAELIADLKPEELSDIHEGDRIFIQEISSKVYVDNRDPNHPTIAFTWPENVAKPERLVTFLEDLQKKGIAVEDGIPEVTDKSQMA